MALLVRVFGQSLGWGWVGRGELLRGACQDIFDMIPHGGPSHLGSISEKFFLRPGATFISDDLVCACVCTSDLSKCIRICTNWYERSIDALSFEPPALLPLSPFLKQPVKGVRPRRL